MGRGRFFRTSALFLSSLGALFLALLPVGVATAQLADASVSRGPTIPFFGIVWFLLIACLMLARIVFLRPGRPAA